METIEVVIYIFLAVVVGGLLIGFVTGWDATQTFDAMKSLFSGDRTLVYEKVTAAQLPASALAVWEECGLGSTELKKTVYLTDTVTITKAALFETFKRSDVCKTIQSAAEGCGSKEDVNMSTLQGPAALTIRCDPATATLVIS
jgi:hypothetical protein